MTDEIAETTLRFIQDAFLSMDDLSIFLFLSARRDRVFMPGSLCTNLKLNLEKVMAGLNRQVQMGLIQTVTTPEEGYQYSPISPGLQALADEVVRLDRERPVTLIRLVSTRPVAPVKAFSDAFKLR